MFESGYYGIKEAECEEKGCCWSPLEEDSVEPWCFYKNSDDCEEEEKVVAVKEEEPKSAGIGTESTEETGGEEEVGTVIPSKTETESVGTVGIEKSGGKTTGNATMTIVVMEGDLVIPSEIANCSVCTKEAIKVVEKASEAEEIGFVMLEEAEGSVLSFEQDTKEIEESHGDIIIN